MNISYTGELWSVAELYLDIDQSTGYLKKNLKTKQDV